MIFGILIIVLLILSFAYMKKNKLVNWILVGTTLRLFFISLYMAGIKLPESQGDAKNFFHEGRAVFEYLFFEGDKIQIINPYSNVIGLSMIFSGDNINFALFMNVFCYIIISYTLYEIIKLIATKEQGIKAVIIMSIFPIDILYSSVLLREQTIIMFMILSFLFLIKYIKKGIFFEFLISVLFHCLGVLFHSGILFLLAVHFYVLFFYKKKVKKIKHKTAKTLALGVFSIVLFKILSKLPKFAFIKDIFNIEYLNHVVVGRFLASTGTGRTAYLTNLVPSNLVEFILYIPLRIIYFLFAPFLWMVGGAGDVFVLLDGTFYIILVILAIKSLKFMDMKIRKVFLLYFFAFTVVFSIGTTNYGTAMRHRHKILWLIVAVAVMPKGQLIVKN